MLLTVSSCSREYYARDADRESYAALAERNTGSWQIPELKIEPPPESRIFVPGRDVAPPMPPDDSYAHEYMRRANGMRGSVLWQKLPNTDTWENPDWMLYLDRDESGYVPINAEKAVELGQTHSIFFRTEVENLYLNALALTLNRFEFATQWYLLNSTFYQHFGTGGFPTETNTLTTTSNLGFRQAFASGGQLLIDFANTFVIEYTGGTSTVTSSISGTLIQPLLRGGGRYVRMEALTQGERQLLYAIRDFARFRKQYYFNLSMRDGGSLGLQLLAQNIRNQEDNVRRLQQIYQLYQFLISRGGGISQVQIDQIFLSLKQAQATLIQSRTTYENALDSYKFTLGLPPSLPIRIEKTLLEQFALNTPDMDALQADLNGLDLKLRQPDQAPGKSELSSLASRLEQLLERTCREAEVVRTELNTRLTILPEQANDPDEQQQLQDLKKLKERLADLFEELMKFEANLKENIRDLSDQEGARDWERLKRRTRELIAIHGDLLVYQTQVRVYAVELKDFPYKEEDCIQQALENRLDLMNEQARVVDSWRRVYVASNALLGGLNIVGGMNIVTEPGSDNPFDFSAKASSYRVGVQLDGPLNRQIERNTFRSSIIQYHRARRTYLNRCDSVVQAIRRNLRQLETDRLNFEIARQSLIAAARQLEATNIRLLIGGDLNPATGTLDTLSALASLLQAKNTLIANWVNYETGRMQLLLDMEAIQLDERGIYRENTIEKIPDLP